MYMKKHRGMRRFFAAAALLLLLLALSWLLYLRWEQPPTLAQDVPEERELRPVLRETNDSAEAEARIAAEADKSGRRPGVYTVLLAGRDDASGNTDTILLARLDTLQHRLDLVSIPRDTLVNLDWAVRKLNAVYAGTANSGGTASEGLRREIRKLCGFSPDCCAVVDHVFHCN